MCFFCLLHAALALVYSGEAATAIESNADLSYTVPKEGSNLWIDSWFIPADSTHKENAEKFLDFLCREDVAMLNFDYVCYVTPNQAVVDAPGRGHRNDAISSLTMSLRTARSEKCPARYQSFTAISEKH